MPRAQKTTVHKTTTIYTAIDTNDKTCACRITREPVIPRPVSVCVFFRCHIMVARVFRNITSISLWSDKIVARLNFRTASLGLTLFGMVTVSGVDMHFSRCVGGASAWECGLEAQLPACPAYPMSNDHTKIDFHEDIKTGIAAATSIC